MSPRWILIFFTPNGKSKSYFFTRARAREAKRQYEDQGIAWNITIRHI